MRGHFSHQLPDFDPTETGEWIDSFDSLVHARGNERARLVVARLLERAQQLDVGIPATVTTPYVNTIPADSQPFFPGDEHLEKLIRRYVRWNAAVMVIRANKAADGIGGHLSTFASSASLYDVGFNWFFRGKDDGLAGDHVYFQGHAAPGIYARAFLEGRLGTDHLDNFRMEIGGRGLSSYPHPRLMPDFWEYPTVSMGLGAINSIYHARFNRYLQHRRIDDTSQSRVWCFVGDGEMDEPETLGAISLAGRSELDNLIWVVNCNLQRLDGPVRGNGKIIQELEGLFRGAGWNVIKVIWGSRWDELLKRDTHGLLLNKMNSTVDGEYQRYATESGAYIRDQFFGPDPRLRDMVADYGDEDLANLPRGGHDHQKLYAAYKAATENTGSPTVILAKTIKGWTLGRGFEGRNATHQIKKMTTRQLLELRDRLRLWEEIPESALADDASPPYYRPPPDAEEMVYMRRRRQALDGPLPTRIVRDRRALRQPDRKIFATFDEGSGSREVSTTAAFTTLLRSLLRDDDLGARIAPIVADEARTFGMDSLFREFEIYAPHGQLYEPVDHDLLLSYTEDTDGQILEEGITEAGSLGRVDRRGHQLRQPGRADGADVHLLLHVRLPAGGRPHLVRRRQPGAGLPAGRHRRAHHADGRGAAAPGRPQPPAGGLRAGVPVLRPGLRLRDGHDHRLRAGAHVPARRRGARRGRVLLPDDLQRESPAARPRRPCERRRHHERPVPLGPRAGGDAPTGPRSCSPGRRTARHGRRRRRWPSTTAAAPSCGAPPPTRGCARRPSTPSAGTACTRRRRPACRS